MNERTSDLMFTVDPAVDDPYEMSIYDTSTNQLMKHCWWGGTACGVTVQPPTNQTRTYKAYVGMGEPPQIGPPADVRASESITVRNVGWIGSSWFQSKPNPTDGRPELWMYSHPEVADPYWMSIYSGNQRAWECRFETWVCMVRAAVGPSQPVKFYQAFIAEHAPETGRPTIGVRATSKVIAATLLSDEELLTSPTIDELEDKALAAFPAAEACLRLGQSARTNAARSSVPDATLVCNAKGLRAAIEFIASTAGEEGAESAVAALYDAAEGNQPPDTHPDCDQVSLDGECLDSGAPPAVDPEPEPAGAGIPPRSNCLDAASRDALRESMPNQDHHVASPYGAWGATFQRIANRYGLSVETGLDWNIVRMPHRGPHPAEYHQWVLENMVAIDEIAAGDVAVFKALFKQYVTDVVAGDPTIVRVAYWKCYR